MKKQFTVVRAYSCGYIHTVEANNQDEAERLAEKDYEENGLKNWEKSDVTEDWICDCWEN